MRQERRHDHSLLLVGSWQIYPQDPTRGPDGMERGEILNAEGGTHAVLLNPLIHLAGFGVLFCSVCIYLFVSQQNRI